MFEPRRFPAVARRHVSVVALILLLTLSGCSSLKGTGDLDYVSGNGKVVQISPDSREAPIEVSGDSLEGDPIDFSTYRGKPLVVNVWASWCGPCRSEMPMLVDAAAETVENAAFLGINVRDTSTQNAAVFQREYGATYPSIYDEGGTNLLRFGSFSPTSMPSTLVLDAQGRVAALISGEVPSEQTLTDIIEEISDESA